MIAVFPGLLNICLLFWNFLRLANRKWNGDLKRGGSLF
ncbi:hypothetical protein LEP1GSC199_0327 [Leptospira vanthielii serovar Holland str. Waz Holland = ATCC 700522]|uniref:Uncharacterized protein n=1 Tax=Leptospira vanthielii serovar Holland str. Waz Holland = ATCC 700522 TaxID=1218591 RepID=N1W3V2_9LEPT|nr:hypothetical protein LEP1GSC199_0327 [Leptospira vanthielii serovar Holland str. Waz Holland = ATCC 700522]